MLLTRTIASRPNRSSNPGRSSGSARVPPNACDEDLGGPVEAAGRDEHVDVAEHARVGLRVRGVREGEALERQDRHRLGFERVEDLEQHPLDADRVSEPGLPDAREVVALRVGDREGAVAHR